MTELAAMFFVGLVLGVVVGICLMIDRREIVPHDDTETGVGRPL